MNWNGNSSDAHDVVGTEFLINDPLWDFAVDVFDFHVSNMLVVIA